MDRAGSLRTCTPFRYLDTMNYDPGICAQDSWTFKRLTVNGGLQFEKLKAGNSALTSPGGRFVPSRSFPEVPNLPDWSDIAPRLGGAYDRFGTGKTALKFSINRCNDTRTTGIAAQYNPLAQATVRLTGRDLNNDDVVPDSELRDQLRTAELELCNVLNSDAALTVRATNYGTAAYQRCPAQSRAGSFASARS